MRAKKNRRDAILVAAADIVREKGAGHLTLDAVSARANVSKGGLLYHFQTKEALLQAMVSRVEEVFTSAREEESAKLDISPARTLKAHILSAGNLQQQNVMSIAVAVLAAGSHNPKLLQDARQSYYDTLNSEMEAAGISSAFVSVVVCALKGLLLSELLGMATYARNQHKDFIDELLRLVNEEEARLCK